MGVTAFSQQSLDSPVVSVDAIAVEDIDILAMRFLELQQKASRAYDDAYMLDLPHEHLKERLIGLVRRLGCRFSDSTVLRGQNYELSLRLAAPAGADSEIICRLRYALIREGIAKGLLQSIFEGKMLYTFTPDADKHLRALSLSKNLKELYKECRRSTQTPILDVRLITGT